MSSLNPKDWHRIKSWGPSAWALYADRKPDKFLALTDAIGGASIQSMHLANLIDRVSRVLSLIISEKFPHIVMNMPLLIACEDGDILRFQAEMTRLKEKAEKKIFEKTLKTSLSIAVEKNNPEIIRLCMHEGAVLDWDQIDLLIKMGNRDLLKWHFESDGENLSDTENAILFQRAIDWGQWQIAEFFFENDVNHQITVDAIEKSLKKIEEIEKANNLKKLFNRRLKREKTRSKKRKRRKVERSNKYQPPTKKIKRTEESVKSCLKDTSFRLACLEKNNEFLQLSLEDPQFYQCDLDQLKTLSIEQILKEFKLKTINMLYLYYLLKKDPHLLESSDNQFTTLSDSEGMTLLHLAAVYNDQEMVRSSLRQGADAKKQDCYAYTPLDRALAAGYFEIVREIATHLNLEFRNVIETKFLAHVFSIKGMNPQKTINYEGFNRGIAQEKLIDLAVDFFNECIDSKGSCDLSGTDAQQLKKIFNLNKLSLVMSAQQLVEQSQEHPVLLFCGWDTHITAVVVYKDLLIKCNRGSLAEEEKYGLQIFHIKNRSNLEICFSKLQKFGTHEKGKEIFINLINQRLDLLPLEAILLRTQKVGNCGWTSGKAAFLAVVYLYFFKDKGVEDSKARLRAMQIYKDWGRGVKQKALGAYQSSTADLEFSSDSNLLETVCFKLFVLDLSMEGM